MEIVEKDVTKSTVNEKPKHAPQKMPMPQTKTFVFWIGFKKYADQVINNWLKERTLAGESPAPFGPKVSTNFFGITTYVFCYTGWIVKN